MANDNPTTAEDADVEVCPTLVFPRAPASGRDTKSYLSGLKDARRFFIDCRHDEKSGRKFLAIIDQVIEEVESNNG